MTTALRAPQAQRAWARLVLVGERLDRMAVPCFVIIGAMVAVLQIAGAVPLPGDAAVYWTTKPGDYSKMLYGYPPVLLQLIEPLRWFGAWQVFLVIWNILLFGAMGFAFGRWSFLLFGALVPDVLLRANDAWWGGAVETLFLGNVTMLMVAGIVAGVARPAWWSLPILTKVTPGVGILWHPVRREWRQFGIGVGTTVAVVAVSFVLNPAAWINYAQFLVANRGTTAFGPPIVGPPLSLRLVAAVALVVVAGLANRPRLIPIAAAISLVGLYGWATFGSVALAAASPRLSRAALRRAAPGEGEGDGDGEHDAAADPATLPSAGTFDGYSLAEGTGSMQGTHDADA